MGMVETACGGCKRLNEFYAPCLIMSSKSSSNSKEAEQRSVVLTQH